MVSGRLYVSSLKQVVVFFIFFFFFANFILAGLPVIEYEFAFSDYFHLPFKCTSPVSEFLSLLQEQYELVICL